MSAETENQSVTEEKKEAGREKRDSGGFWNGLIFGILLSVLVVGSIYIGRNVYYLIKVHQTQAEAERQTNGQSVVDAETLRKMRTVEEVINRYYYGEEITDKELREGIYRGMVEALNDPYSEYYSKEELEDVLETNEGISYGIGAYISLHQATNTAMISGVMEGTPAQEAGLREGDLIYKVDDVNTQGMSVSKVVRLVKGKKTQWFI